MLLHSRKRAESSRNCPSLRWRVAGDRRPIAPARAMLFPMDIRYGPGNRRAEDLEPERWLARDGRRILRRLTNWSSLRIAARLLPNTVIPGAPAATEYTRCWIGRRCVNQ